MGLDVSTLFLVTIYVEAMLGLLLLFAWIQNSNIRAVAWWGCAHLLRAGSIVLFGMYGTVSDAISIDLANAILFTAFAVTWSGARVFDGRALEPMYLVGGAVLWILLSRAPFLLCRRLFLVGRDCEKVQPRTLRTKAATACPISSGESSCRKCRPFTVTSVWFGQARQTSR